MRLGVLRVLFVVLVVVWSLIFWGSGFFGHFRTARSGVYMVSRRTDSVIRFGFLVEWMDAHFRYYSTAPPDCSLTRQSETAGRVKKGLGLAVSLILRSVSEDSAGKGHSDSVVPPAGC